tara:strand:- start:53 stop:1045 length:993 start_codon:yes stop_codon:yes gene_type:complete
MRFGRDLWNKPSKEDIAERKAKKCRMSMEEVHRILATIDHELVGEYVNTRTLVDARHTCGKINQVTIGAIVANNVKHGCLSCAVKEGKMLALTNEEATKIVKSFGFTPTEKYPGKNKPWSVTHDVCGEEVTPRLANLTKQIAKGGTGCQVCARKVSADKRRAKPKQITDGLAKQNLYQIGKYVRNNDPFQVGCFTCGRDDLMMTYSDIHQEHGCRYCNGGPFTMNPSLVYLMKHTEKNALKVGITTQGKVGDRRIREHSRCGFSLVDTWDFDTGELAYEVEQEVLRHWREDLNAPPVLAPEEMTHQGHTETVSMRKVGMRNTVEYINNLV